MQQQAVITISLAVVSVLGGLSLVPLLTKIIFRQWFEEKQKFMERLAGLSESVSKYQQIH